MNIPYSLIIVAVAGLIHASFQLSTSVLTLLSSHTIGKKRSHAVLLRLTNAYVLGAGVMTTLLLSFVALCMNAFGHGSVSALEWTVGCGSLMSLGLAVWLFYYRKERGTTLWVPRSAAKFLSTRSKATRNSAEAFGLGLSSVVFELLFIAAPIIVSGFVLVGLPEVWQAIGIGLYLVISMGSLVIVNGLIGSGHKISRIQRWREENKRFLQFAGGSGLLILGFYVYVEQVVTASVYATGGM